MKIKNLFALLGLAGSTVLAAEAKNPIQGWPGFDEREQIVREIPGFSEFIMAKKWDDFEIDRFLFRVKKIDEMSLRKIYPTMSETLLKDVKAKLNGA